MRSLGLLMALSFLVGGAFGQDFPQIYNSEADRDAKPLSALIAAQGMQTPPGFRTTVFASEPDVQNPIGMAWDAKGRLWIAENYTYAERSQRFDLSLRDRVLVLEDTDHDGVADQRRIFSDQLQMLTSVEVGRGGVWVMCPPQLLFIPDADGDAVPDGPPQVILDGFEVAKENYHNFANGLKWGPDGWLYGRCGGSCPGRIGRPGAADTQRIALEGGVWRYDPRSQRVEVLCHGTTNPWGHDWNALGEAFFINTVNGHLWHLIPGAHLHRPFTLDPNPHVYELLDMHADHWHFDTGAGWQQSRDGKSNSYGGGHAHTGMMIYQGDNWPERFRGNLFTLNLHGRRVNQELLKRSGSGYVASHGDDMLLSPDPFFRGIDLSCGPDGAVYVLDWSDNGECHEHTGVHRTSGRIFRVSHTAREGSTPGNAATIGPLDELSDEQLIELLSHANAWYPRQAALLLAQRAMQANDFSLQTAALREMVGHENPVLAFRALSALFTCGAADGDFLRTQLRHANEHLRVAAIRYLTDGWPLDDVFGPTAASHFRLPDVSPETTRLVDDLRGMARKDDSALVRLALALTIQRLPVQHRLSLADALMSRGEDAGDHNLPLLVWYGLIPTATAKPTGLAEIGLRSTWPQTQRLIARRLAELLETHPEGVRRMLKFVATTKNPAACKNVLAGLADGLKGWTKAPKPADWDRVVAAAAASRDAALIHQVRELSVVFGEGRALAEVKRLVLDPQTEIALRKSALSTMVAVGGEELVDICLPLLKDARLNVIAAQGLSQHDQPRIARELVANYRRFRGPERPRVISILVSRPSFASALLDALAAGKVPATDLTAFDVRQIHSLNDPLLTERVGELWGKVRDTPLERRARISELKSRLDATALAQADLPAGRRLFEQSCVKCHRLFGNGQAVGPDLTGANRTNMDYLLENVLDPSAVVNKDFRMSILKLKDGRVLNGLIVVKNDKTLTLQTQTELQTVALASIESIRETDLSPMPDGLFDNLTFAQIRDLVAYLRQPSQIELTEAAQQ